jgi:hypothetical protein
MDLRETGCGLNSSVSEECPVADSYEHDNEHLGSIKYWEFPDYLNDTLLVRDSAPWSYLTRGCIRRSFHLMETNVNWLLG